jgi:beta-phosphoglucomutase-like phosphatase (HAD superfamily)
MKQPEYVAGAIYDVDDTLLRSQPTDDPLSNLHQIARLAALHTIADKYDYCAQLRDVGPQENFDSFAASPVHTIFGAFHTLLKNRGILTGEVDPTHPLILELVALKDEEYGRLLPLHGRAVEGADTFVRDFSAHHNINDYNAIASTAIMRDIKTFLAMSNLTALFPDERIIDVAKVSRPKPDPEAFNRAFLSLGLPESARSHVIAFEDDPRGIASARAAGLFVCGITTRYPRDFLESLDDAPHLVADSYTEFRKHFGLDC